MLHKAPVVLAVSSILFVGGVLFYAAGDHLGTPTLQGQLMGSIPTIASSMPGAPMMSSSMAGVPMANNPALGANASTELADIDPGPDGPWIDPNSNWAPVTLDGDVSMEGMTAGVTGGDSGSSGGAAVATCPFQFKVFKTTDREVCRCGKSADDMQKVFTEHQQKLLNGNANAAPACPAPRCVDEPGSQFGTIALRNPTFYNITPFKIIRTRVAGRGDASKSWEKAHCKIGQLVACFKAEGKNSAMRSCVTPAEAKEIREEDGANTLPPINPIDPPATYKCCISPRGSICANANAVCPEDSKPASDGKRYVTQNCDQQCKMPAGYLAPEFPAQ